MGEFDKIIKENIEAIFVPLLEKLLNLSINKTIEIKDKLQVTIEREPDYLKKIIDHEGREFILHLEFQTQDDHEMVYRMAEYKAILQRKHRIPVKQCVIYLGARKPTMRTRLTEEEQIIGFDLRNISDLPIQKVLESTIPEEIILAILTDYPSADAEHVVSEIIRKLQSNASDEIQLNKAIQQLLILSRLRNLETITKEKTDQMPITYDITEDGLYKQGIEIGREEGLEEGIEQGKVEGRQEGKDYMIIRALQQGLLNIEQIAEMAEVELSYVMKLDQDLSDL